MVECLAEKKNQKDGRFDPITGEKLDEGNNFKPTSSILLRNSFYKEDRKKPLHQRGNNGSKWGSW